MRTRRREAGGASIQASLPPSTTCNGYEIMPAIRPGCLGNTSEEPEEDSNYSERLPSEYEP